MSGSKDADETMVLYMGVGSVLGLSVGSALGVAFGNIAIGVSIGLALGLAFGGGFGAAAGIERKTLRWMVAGLGVSLLGIVLFAYVDDTLGRFTVFVGFFTIVLGIVLNIAASRREKRGLNL